MGNDRYNTEKQIVLTEEERGLIYYQLSARKDYFEEDMISAASRKDLTRISECAKAIESIQKIQNMMIG